MWGESYCGSSCVQGGGVEVGRPGAAWCGLVQVGLVGRGEHWDILFYKCRLVFTIWNLHLLVDADKSKELHSFL